jgi:hypothetical protein
LGHDSKFPNEPRQIKPGEDVRNVGEGGQQKVQVSGQVAVMSINGLLTKIIFDKNPDHGFYIEESFPLDWMYPHLSPNGLIMKINRQPLPELSDDIVRRDREYWRSRVAGMIADWLNEGTSVSDLTKFVEKIYVRKDLAGFSGDPRFVQNHYAKASFSKWRASIAGVYVWRMEHAANESEKARMGREADFAFRQAWALCPYSSEAVFRYVNLLKSQNRISDAILIIETAATIGRGMPFAFDKDRVQARDLIKQLKKMQEAK